MDEKDIHPYLSIHNLYRILPHQRSCHIQDAPRDESIICILVTLQILWWSVLGILVASTFKIPAESWVTINPGPGPKSTTGRERCSKPLRCGLTIWWWVLLAGNSNLGSASDALAFVYYPQNSSPSTVEAGSSTIHFSIRIFFTGITAIVAVRTSQQATAVRRVSSFGSSYS